MHRLYRVLAIRARVGAAPPDTRYHRGMRAAPIALLVAAMSIASSGCQRAARVVSCDEPVGGVRTCWEWHGLSRDLEGWHRGLCHGHWAGACPRATALGACTGGAGDVLVWYYPSAAAGLRTAADVKRLACDRNGATFIAP